MDMTDNPSAEKIADYSTAKLELEKIYEYITDGIIMRSKSQWYEEGENLLNIFFLWRKEIKSNHISENFVLMRRMKKQQIPNRIWTN